jgi:putative membrane protein
VDETSPSREQPAAPESDSLRELVVVYCKGLAMGTADAVPGVSGGTIALITGIYERLIRAITRLDPGVLALVPRLRGPEGRSAFLDALREMDAFFLVALGLGMGTAIVSVARVMEVALESARRPTFAFFFGLIAASALVLYERRWLAGPGRIAAAVAGFVVAFLVSGAAAAGVFPNTLPATFLAGAVAISGMILPGISGSLILLLLGQYSYMVATLNGLVDQLLSLVTGGTSSDQLLSDGAVVVAFLGGAVVGLFTVAYAVRWALDRFRAATFAFLVSLMVGALRFPAAEIASETDSLGLLLAVQIVAAVAVGAAAVLVLDWFSADMDYE